MTTTARPAASYRKDLDDLVARSRRIGSRQDLVVHGGGNTSTKTEGTDHLGRPRPVLLIKASGGDLATLTEGGICALYLDDLLALRDRAAMDDAEMSDLLARSMLRPSSPRPSIETLLHAFLPHRSVDHVHADAICALTNGPDARAAVTDALGADVAFIDWIRPGFALSKMAATFAGAEAIVLGHHGLVTWSDTPDGSLDRALAIVDRARRFLDERRPARPARSVAAAGLDIDLLVHIRGRLSRRRRRVLHVDGDRGVSDRPDVDRIAEAGPATADHLMHIRPWAAVIRSRDDVDAAVGAIETRYAAYFARHAERAPAGTSMHDPAPTVALVPGLGTVTAGRHAREAQVVADVARHSHAVAAAAIDAFASARTLGEEDVFEVDYWPLELAKRAQARETPELEGRVYVVTGAGGAIGRAIARAIARMGAQVVATDLDADALGTARDEIAAAGHAPEIVVADIAADGTAESLMRAAVGAFGGLDGIVSNAGIALTGALADVDRAQWDRSMAVNATSHFLLVRAALPLFEAQGLGGSVVFVASKNAFSPGRGFGPYSAAKAAEVQIARMAALEGGRIGVRSNVVNPDAVFGGSRLWSPELRASRAAAHGVPADRLEGFYASRNLLGVEVRAEDVAEAVVFLLSDRSSRTTGCVITVDGGLESAFPR